MQTEEHLSELAVERLPKRIVPSIEFARVSKGTFHYSALGCEPF